MPRSDAIGSAIFRPIIIAGVVVTHNRESFNSIPRHLIRVSTPNSDGTTDRIWIKSKDARYASANGRVDILAKDDNQQVAGTLNRHLCWWGKPTDPDNLVSWASSLLFAFQYIFYRHNHSRDRSSLDGIDLCIVDTATFPEGVFLPDMDLIHAYRSFDENLRDLEDLRRKKHRSFCRILLLWRIPVAGCTENRRQVPNHFSAGNHRPEVVLITTRV
jgi:hypothetical protein